jgi:hypothetical protein
VTKKQRTTKPKTKPKPKPKPKPKLTPTERSKRFVEMAKKAGGATDPKVFDEVFDKIVGRK